MKMQVRHMFGALAVSAAAAMLAACGQSVPTQDPSATVTQPVAPPPPPVAVKVLPATAANEPLTANSHYNTHYDARYYSATSTQVEGVEGCLNSAKEASYMASQHMYSSRTDTSCVAKDGTARARFSCEKTSATGVIACSPN